jgi:thiamine biosynthesis lipoprotein
MVLTPPTAAARPDEVPLDYRADGWCKVSFRAMGTDCQLMYCADSRGRGKEFRDHAVEWVMDFERKYSRFREDSMISEINRNAGVSWMETDEELDSMLVLCDWFNWDTGGVFDPTSLPLARLWDYHGETPRVPSAAEVERAKALVGWSKVQRRKGGIFLPEAGMALDLGGIGKEYAVDRVFEMAQAAGFKDVMVDFGRDIRVGGESPNTGGWRIGLEHPLDPGRCWTALLLSNRAVTTSGDYLRGFTAGGRYYGHILDPRTGYPTDNGCRACSVIAPTCTEAGIISTAALILGREGTLSLIGRHSLAAACLWQGEHLYETPRFANYLAP